MYTTYVKNIQYTKTPKVSITKLRDNIYSCLYSVQKESKPLIVEKNNKPLVKIVPIDYSSSSNAYNNLKAVEEIRHYYKNKPKSKADSVELLRELRNYGK